MDGRDYIGDWCPIWLEVQGAGDYTFCCECLSVLEIQWRILQIAREVNADHQLQHDQEADAGRRSQL